MLLKDAAADVDGAKLDPIFSFTVGVAQAWAREVWARDLPFQLLDRALTTQARRLVGVASPWKFARGPAAATLLMLRRIGWSMPSARTFADEYGTHIDLFEYGPKDVAVLVGRGVHRYVSRCIAAQLGQPLLAEGMALKPLAAVIA
eukprot:354894-Karenia_brevis.AAC.1